MRVIRVIERPAIEAALARFSAWWDGLSPRERILVGTLGTLLALTILIYGVVKPLQAARADALADIRSYETINARLRAAGPSPRPATAMRSGPPDQIVTQSAAGFGLAPAVTLTGAGADAVLTDAAYESVLQWVADVERTTPLRAARVEITRAAPGRVAARLSFAP